MNAAGRLALVIVLTLSVIAVMACGISHPRLGPRDTDGDVDRLGEGPYDYDHDATLSFGGPALGHDRSAIVALVRAYYTAAADGDGAKACGLLYQPAAESTVEEYRQRWPRWWHGATCTDVMNRLFASRRAELMHDAVRMGVGAVQTRGRRALAIVRFGVYRERRIWLHRDGHSWKMAVAFDNGAP